MTFAERPVNWGKGKKRCQKAKKKKSLEKESARDRRLNQSSKEKLLGKGTPKAKIIYI